MLGQIIHLHIEKGSHISDYAQFKVIHFVLNELAEKIATK